MLDRLKSALGRRMDNVRERVGSRLVSSAPPTSSVRSTPRPAPTAPVSTPPPAPVRVQAPEVPPAAETAPTPVTPSPTVSPDVAPPAPPIAASAAPSPVEITPATPDVAPRAEKAASTKATKTKATETKATETKATETKAAETKATEAKAAEGKAAETKPAEVPPPPQAAPTQAVTKDTPAGDADGQPSIAARALALAKGKNEAKIVHADMGSTDLEHYIARAKANNRDLSTIKGTVGMNVNENGEKFWGPVDNSSSRAKAKGQLLTVDQWECISCGTCVEQTDKVFYLPDDGKATPIAQDGPMDLIEDAIEACPVTCIHWVDPDEAEEKGLATGLEADSPRPQ